MVHQFIRLLNKVEKSTGVYGILVMATQNCIYYDQWIQNVKKKFLLNFLKIRKEISSNFFILTIIKMS